MRKPYHFDKVFLCFFWCSNYKIDTFSTLKIFKIIGTDFGIEEKK